MTHREAMFGKANYVPTSSIDALELKTYYLTKVDDKFRRYYALKDETDK